MESALEDKLPRQAYFKVGKSVNQTVLKKEVIEYVADKAVIKVSSQPATVRFRVSGDALLDGRESYFSLKLKTNTFTAFLSGDITSIIKKVTIKLPSNSNQILEEIDSYNTLSSMIQMLQLDKEDMISNWHNGSNCLLDHNKPEAQQRSRRFMNLNEGGYRTFVFQLNLSSILYLEQFLPLSLLNGILVEIQLASAQEVFHYDSDLETPATVFNEVERFYLTQAVFDGLGNDDRQAVWDQLLSFYERPMPTGQDLQYEVKDFTFNAAVIWMNAEYAKRLVDKAMSDTGINLFFDTFRFNQIPNEGSLMMHVNLTEQYQNMKRILFATMNKTRFLASKEHSFNTFESNLSTYKFRIGSRSWQTVSNADPASSYAQTRQAMRLLNNFAPNAISFAKFSRTHNIHGFDFEKVHDDSHSGEDTSNGRNIRMELQFQSNTAIDLVDNAGVPMADAGGNVLNIKRGKNPADSVIYLYQLFTRMINISNKGIAVTE